jgi:hypothetical protein
VAKKKQKKAKAVKKKKTATAATTRSTAGPGFHFEDQVAAWLLLQALTGQELPGIEGTVTRLHRFQPPASPPWKQWDAKGEHPMRRDADCLMLATRQRHNTFQATWSEIKLAAADADPALGLAACRNRVPVSACE